MSNTNIPVIGLTVLSHKQKMLFAKQLQVAPDHIRFFWLDANAAQQMMQPENLQPGEAIQFTDGAGKAV